MAPEDMAEPVSPVLLEINEAANIITESIDPNAKVIFGAVIDDSIRKGEIQITVVATGFDENKQVFTKQQKGDEDVDDAFGLGGISVKSPMYNNDDDDDLKESKESFFDEPEQDETSVEEEPEEEVYKGAPKKNDIDDDDFDDPLDKPAFMRRMFPGKKK